MYVEVVPGAVPVEAILVRPHLWQFHHDISLGRLRFVCLSKKQNLYFSAQLMRRKESESELGRVHVALKLNANSVAAEADERN